MVVFTISTGKVLFENRFVAIGISVLLCTFLHIVQRKIRTYSQYRCMRGVQCLHLVYSSLVCSRRVMYCLNSSESSIT